MPPISVAPVTESQCFPASGSFGFFVASSVGHFASVPTREPKFDPSRSGFRCTLNTVPGANDVPVIPCCAMAACLVLIAVLFQSPVSTHHSFAMYDQTKTVTLTGVMKQFVPQANHAELHFILLAPDHKALAKSADGKYVEWGVEMAGTAAVAQQGITSTSFPPGTVFSVHLNPLRDGSNFGSRVGALARCPTDPATKKPKLPEAGKHCDSVAGRELIGGANF